MNYVLSGAYNLNEHSLHVSSKLSGAQIYFNIVNRSLVEQRHTLYC